MTFKGTVTTISYLNPLLACGLEDSRWREGVRKGVRKSEENFEEECEEECERGVRNGVEERCEESRCERESTG